MFDKIFIFLLFFLINPFGCTEDIRSQIFKDMSTTPIADSIDESEQLYIQDDEHIIATLSLEVS